MPGDEWQRFANLRLLYGFMFTHPGTQLLFMGGEFGQTSEWSLERGLDWDLLQYDYHKQAQTWVKDLNHFYATGSTALYEKQFEPEASSGWIIAIMKIAWFPTSEKERMKTTCCWWYAISRR